MSDPAKPKQTQEAITGAAESTEPVNESHSKTKGRAKKTDAAKPKEETNSLVTTGTTTLEKWVLLTAYAPLQIVQTSNYLRYGADGVRRFGPGAPTETLTHPADIQIKMTLKHAGNDVLHTYQKIIMHPSDPQTPFDLEGTNIWEGSLAGSRLRIWWVWDFYRLYSGLRLLVETPPKDAAKDWQAAADTLLQLRPGDQIVIEVNSKSSNILQVYPIDRVAIETTQQP